MPIRLPLLAAGLLFASTAFAEDWPAFRGPNRDGISKETGLLKTWSKDGPPIAWTAITIVRLLDSRQNVMKLENMMLGLKWNGIGQFGVDSRR